MTDLETELKQLIVEALLLEDVAPEQIESDEPLFVDGLGLDSIDALEIGMAVSRRYRIKIKADDKRNRKAFHSVRSLAAFIEERRKDGGRDDEP